MYKYKDYPFKKIEGHKSFFGPLIPLDFWGRPLWVSKPELAALFALGGGIRVQLPPLLTCVNILISHVFVKTKTRAKYFQFNSKSMTQNPSSQTPYLLKSRCDRRVGNSSRVKNHY